MTTAALDIFNETETATSRSGEYPVAPIVDELERRRARAKHLPLVHSAKLGRITDQSTVDFTPSRLSSVVRSRGRCGAAALFVELMVVSGVTSADVASAIDVVPQRVAQMRSGERAVELGDLLLMVERLPSVRAVFVKLVVQMLGGEEK